jgi:hypothetical protein
MKFTLLKALMLPLALLALGSVHNASAATCSTTYTMTAVSASSFSCTIGNLTFSNFDPAFQPGIDAGCTGPCTAAGIPDPTANISVNFDMITSGSDPFGTGASDINPIIQVITAYSGGTTVNEFQNESGIVQYLVTAIGGASVTEVDAAFTGFADTDGASGSFNKNLCNNNQFEGGSDPNGICPSSSTNLQVAVSDLPLAPTTQSDGSPDFAGIINDTTFGVEDQWVEDGGTPAGGSTSSSAAATITSDENDFQETLPSGTPEPATFVLAGAVLVALGAIRRKKIL